MTQNSSSHSSLTKQRGYKDVLPSYSGQEGEAVYTQKTVLFIILPISSNKITKETVLVAKYGRIDGFTKISSCHSVQARSLKPG